MECHAPRNAHYISALILAAFSLSGTIAIHIRVYNETPARGNGTNSSSPSWHAVLAPYHEPSALENGTNRTSPSAHAVNISTPYREPSEIGNRTNDSSASEHSVNMSESRLHVVDFDEFYEPHENTCSDLEDVGLEIVFLGDVQPDNADATTPPPLVPLTPNTFPPHATDVHQPNSKLPAPHAINAHRPTSQPPPPSSASAGPPLTPLTPNTLPPTTAEPAPSPAGESPPSPLTGIPPPDELPLPVAEASNATEDPAHYENSSATKSHYRRPRRNKTKPEVTTSQAPQSIHPQIIHDHITPTNDSSTTREPHHYPRPAEPNNTVSPDIPFDSASFRKPMIWFHIHKAAGSMMCTLAKLNGEVPIEYGRSACLWLNQDFWFPIPQYGGYPGTPSCDERLQFLEYEKGRGTDGRAVSWLQIERPFRAQDFCPGSFRYGVMLREPLRLALSMTNFRPDWELYQGNRYKDIIKCLATNDNSELCEHSPHLYSLRLWMYYDNFVVRLLDGLDTYRLPPGGVTAMHTYRTINMLKKFDVVTILEDLEEDTTATTFKTIFGWNYTVAPRINAYNENEDIANKITFDESETEFIKDRIKYDYAVYWYFKRASTAVRPNALTDEKSLFKQHGMKSLSCKAAMAKAKESSEKQPPMGK